MLRNNFIQFVLPKIKFGAGSAVSTGIDFGIFYMLLTAAPLFPIFAIQAIAQSCGMISNFIIQRNLIFKKLRTLKTSFLLSIGSSLIGILLASTMIHYLYLLPFFNEYPMLLKAGITILFFFFNYYSKQFAFETKITW